MKKLIVLLTLMISSFISFSQTTAGDITPDKIVKDTSNGKTYWMWETPKAKEIAKELERGLINGEKVDALEKKIDIMEEKDKMCENLNDSLKLANDKGNQIIKNQDEIIKNDNKIISEHQDINVKKGEIIQKQEKKIKRKNGFIKTLVGTNVGTAVVVVILIIL